MENMIFNINDFWDRIKFLCKKNGMTQKELSVSLGLSPRFIESQIFTKVTPDIEEVLNISRIFDVSLSYLITGKETKSNETESLINDISIILKKYTKN